MRLHAREVQPEAHVRAPREREVLLRRPEDVEGLGVLPVALVVVGRADVHRDRWSRPGSATPSTSVSRVAVRMMPSSGGSHRRPSSIACGISARSSRSASSWSGFVSSPTSRLLDERYVVSAPAGSSSRRNAQISSSVRCVPSSSACGEHRDHVVGRVDAPVGDDRAEVVVERLRRRESRARGRSRR